MSYRPAKLSVQAGVAALAVFLGTSAGWADEILPRSAESEPVFHTLQRVVEDANHVSHEPPVASERASITSSNFEVKKLGGEDSSVYELSYDLTIRWRIEPEPFEVDFERRRAVLEEKARVKRLLEILAEDIDRARRERAAEQRKELTLEVDEPPEP